MTGLVGLSILTWGMGACTYSTSKKVSQTAQQLSQNALQGQVQSSISGKAMALRSSNKTLSLPLKSKKRYKSVLIGGVPHIKQKSDFCGEACIAMYMRKLGHKVDQDFVFDQMGVSPLKARGAVTRDMVKGLRRLGFKPGKTWYAVQASKAHKGLERQWRLLHNDLKKSIPSIVCMHYDSSPNTTEHFRLILGYDQKKDEVIFHEPAVSGASYKRMKRRLFFKLWPLKYKKKEWLVIRMRLKAGKLKKGRISTTFTKADYAQHIMKLKKKLPKGFHIVIQPPFVVVGDESASMVRRRARGTVRWAVQRLKALYFDKDPKDIITVWLFGGRRSYTKYTKKIFNDTPGTPYGYYSYRHKALIMNIATGGGTLVHEIVHPFMAANFKNVPAWFNEGMGSLYEQCGDRKGRIVGFTNWRLAGLQSAIRKKQVPSFYKLLSTTENQFYNQDPGTNYSQSRYLCYYLQEKGLLVKYYKTFHRNKRSDPSGYKTLRKILKVRNMKAFKKKWEKWVLKLRYP